MAKFKKPTIVVSKCLEFEACRYDGHIISSEVVKALKPLVDFTTVCPEVEIGLGVPRDPIRIITNNGDLRLIQSSTNKDISEEMSSFTAEFLSGLGDEVDAFILKGRSPSCGIKDVKVYKDPDSKAPLDYKVSGFFGGGVIDKFGDYPVESEGRLMNFRIREHFLTVTYTFAEFRDAKKSGEMSRLLDFHTGNKYLFMAYNQQELKTGGNILANHQRKSFNEVVRNYEKCLFRILSQMPEYTSHINVLMHLMGYFSGDLSSDEKEFFLNQLQQYRREKLPLSALTSIMKSWAIRFEDEYLLKQRYLEPFPNSLVEITDSGKGRDLR